MARARATRTGYHAVCDGAYEQDAGLLAPLSALSPGAAAFISAHLLADPLADLCHSSSSPSAAEEEVTIHTTDRAWRARAERRVALTAAASLRAEGSDAWLWQDGGLARLLVRSDPPEHWTRVVGCVKTHQRVPGGVGGEQILAALRLGERSEAFQLRFIDGAARAIPVDTDDELDGCAPIAWYLRVCAAALSACSRAKR